MIRYDEDNTIVSLKHKNLTIDQFRKLHNDKDYSKINHYVVKT